MMGMSLTCILCLCDKLQFSSVSAMVVVVRESCMAMLIAIVIGLLLNVIVVILGIV